MRHFSVIFLLGLISLHPLHIYSCTGIKINTNTGIPVHGRTVEFGTDIDIILAFIPRNLNLVGKTPQGAGLKYKTKYAALGLIAYQGVNILDGINEKGLSVAAFYFPGFAQYQPASNANQKYGLSPADFPNWLLTQFDNIEQIRKAISSKKIIITPTVIKG